MLEGHGMALALRRISRPSKAARVRHASALAGSSEGSRRSEPTATVSTIRIVSRAKGEYAAVHAHMRELENEAIIDNVIFPAGVSVVGTTEQAG